MLVVPLHKDTITTKDGNRYRVVSYTNYKDGGPAVYVRSAGSKDLVLVYFFDIDTINKTKVEYQSGPKVFRALGKIHREQHLPQPDDRVVVLREESSADQDGKDTAEVAGLKLKSKSLGVNRGLHIKDTDGKYYRLKQVFDVKRALGGSRFDRDSFIAYYKDYAGV